MEEKIDTLQQIELSEGVVINLRIAGPIPRGLAFLLDMVIQVGITIGISFALLLVGEIMGIEIAMGVTLLILFFLWWFYFVYFEAGKRGATPGKRAFGLRVVKPSGAPITLGQAIIRNFLRIADSFPAAFLLGLASCVLTRNFQRLGDLAADTVVVYDSVPVTAPRPVVPMLRDAGPLAPPVALAREEQQAMAAYLERQSLWSQARKEELASHAVALTGVAGAEGAERLLRMGAWVETAQGSGT